MRGTLHLSVALLAVTTLGAGQVTPQVPVPAPGDASFAVLYKGVRVGSENVSLTRVGTGWHIVSTTQQNQPVNMQGGVFDVSYDADWSPQQLSVTGTLRGQPVQVTTTFSSATATSVITNAADPSKTNTVVHSITPRAVVLPSGFYGAYEALAARLASMAVGDTVALYLAPDGELRASIDAIVPRHIATPSARLTLREFDLTVRTGAPQSIQVWVDERNRLAQLSLPGAGIAVARDDLATVMAREEHVHNAGDTSTFLPMPGFTVGATITVPAATATSTARHPVVILVPGFGPQDRDMLVGGVPVFGLLAGALADAGNVVVRYDRRGVGQSGGRPENATLEDYRDDLIEIVKSVRKRKDVDGDRVAIIGYQDGAAVAMLTAAKDDDVKGVALVAAAGSTGRDYVLEQQTRALAALPLSNEERAGKVALEQRVIAASLSGMGWELLPADVSHGADRPIFKSWLLFDPVKAMSKIDQPVLILQGLADVDVPRAHGDRLLAAAQARKRPPSGTQSALLPGVTHTLTLTSTSSSGAPGQDQASLAPEAVTALSGWLRGVFGHGK